MLKVKNLISSEKPILDAVQLVRWKLESNSYNFKDLPKTAILSINRSFLTLGQRVLSKKLKGLSGHNYLLNANYIFCCEFGKGAPSITTLMEELRCFGVMNFIFLGYAGTIQTIDSKELCIVKSTFSTTGCSFLYSAEENIASNFNSWLLKLKEHLNLEETVCWSTDAPLRETPTLVNYFHNKGAKHIDMECAAVYAFATFHNLNALCLVAPADTIHNMQWTPPTNLPKINRQMKSVVQKILNFKHEN
ncbi:hypothetical protein [Flavobacterium sp.]|uniref:phosphorylase family protein n=1 Tax=Flavobacterium sp. TaxID=239 RepID=UPI003D09F8D2